MRRLLILLSLFFGCTEQNHEYSMMSEYLKSNDYSQVHKDLIFLYNLEGCYSCLNSLYNLQEELKNENDMGVILVGLDIHHILERFDTDKILFKDEKQQILRYIPDFSNGVILELKNKKLTKIQNEQEVYNYYNSL